MADENAACGVPHEDISIDDVELACDMEEGTSGRYSARGRQHESIMAQKTTRKRTLQNHMLQTSRSAPIETC